VLLRQLDPEVLMDELEELRLAPIMFEWTDDAGDAQPPAEGDGDGDRDADANADADAEDAGHADARAQAADTATNGEMPRPGEVWAVGFMEVVATFTEDWPEDFEAAHGEMAESFEDCLARVALLGLHEAADIEKATAEIHPGETPARDDLIQDALFAVQDLRVLFVEAAPKPETRRVGAQPGRNDPCPCGSGKKFKKCHGA
jgi:uncharacterized protein